MSRVLLVVIASAALAAAGCAQSGQMSEDTAVDSTEQTVEASRQSPSPAPARASRPSMVKVPKGTPIKIQVNAELNSGVNMPGDPFAAKVVEDVMRKGQVRIPAGSQIFGIVQEVRKAKRGAGKASLTVRFDKLEIGRSFSAPIVATLSESTESKKKRNAAVIGGGAAGGALVGKIFGKNTKSAVLGSVVGGAIGTGVIMAKEGEQVVIPYGTELMIKLNQPVSVPRQ
jgi:hypothetical protein